MGRRALRAFTDVDELRIIGARALSELLGQHEKFFAGYGIELTEDNETFPFNLLIDVLQQERESLPVDLAGTLYLISEMSDSTGMDMLLDIARAEGLINAGEEDELSPADIAVRVYLHNASLIEDRHDQRKILNKRSFNYYTTGRPYPRKKFSISPKAVEHFELICGDEFRGHSRGKGAKLKVFPDEKVVRLLVRHGESLTRKGIIQSGESASIFFRPEKFDGFHFDMEQGILGIPNGPKWQNVLYRKAFGLLLYGSEDAFRDRDIFTFNPLILHGPDSLACPSLPEIEHIRLICLEWGLPEQDGDSIKINGADVFAVLEKSRTLFPEEKITKARFCLRFKHTGEERYLEIQGTRKIICQCDTDFELLRPWFAQQGFFISAERENNPDIVIAAEENADAVA